ncbi:hypothetical protein T265_03701 [Opisthorchis viverrini]|uniref:Uncharacterized protein n=1 Tax=Opisthorchis viverrini TaxID=6198 RepID=A0A075A2L9_OPIVI|nr:hypothetical protein T265_03701 [Opisthorchis viverrini]KER29795.1 hypothetical protein T265_03701 [Opisthorchis viverrini]
MALNSMNAGDHAELRRLNRKSGTMRVLFGSVLKHVIRLRPENPPENGINKEALSSPKRTVLYHGAFVVICPNQWRDLVPD